MKWIVFFLPLFIILIKIPSSSSVVMMPTAITTTTSGNSESVYNVMDIHFENNPYPVTKHYINESPTETYQFHISNGHYYVSTERFDVGEIDYEK